MIFISYSRHDQAVCDEIVRALEERGHEVWLDRKAIRGGDVWRANIEQGIKKADIFLILLSGHMSEYVQGELELAHKHRKKIIALRLKLQEELPEGYELILSGRQYIEMSDFGRGLCQLLEALGDVPIPSSVVPPSLWGRAVRKAQRVRAVLANSEVGPVALKFGAAALAGAVTVAAVVAKKNEEKRQDTLQTYRAAIDSILLRCTKEIVLTKSMTPEEYIREFRPRIQRLLGKLEATGVPNANLKRHHDGLMAHLQRTVDEYDLAVTHINSGEVEAFQRAVTRVVSEFSETLQAHKKLLDSMA